MNAYVSGRLLKCFPPLLVAMALMPVPPAGAALEPGHPAKPPEKVKWLGGDPFADMTDENARPVVLLFWSSSIFGSKPSLRLLSSMRSVYKKEGIRFAAITKESEKVAKDFIAKNPDITVAVGVDDGGRVFKSYMGTETGLPYAFVIEKNWKLAWRGRVSELGRVVPLVLTGSFDYTKQRQIEDLHRELEGASQYMDTPKESSTADKILLVDPADRQAVESKTRILARSGDMEGVFKIFAEARKSAADSTYIVNNLYLMEMSVLALEISERSRNRLREVAGEFYEKYKDDSAALDAMSIAIVGGAPFEIVPVDGLLRMASRGVELAEKENDKPAFANALRTISRVYHLLGCLDKAAAAQGKACEIMGADSIPPSMPLLEQFYKDALAVQQAQEAKK